MVKSAKPFGICAQAAASNKGKSVDLLLECRIVDDFCEQIL
jgi:hypothetical protein